MRLKSLPASVPPCYGWTVVLESHEQTVPNFFSANPVERHTTHSFPTGRATKRRLSRPRPRLGSHGLRNLFGFSLDGTQAQCSLHFACRADIAQLSAGRVLCLLLSRPTWDVHFRGRGFQGMSGRGPTFLTYGPGEVVPRPGVYAVLHGKPHVSYLQLFVDNIIAP